MSNLKANFTLMNVMIFYKTNFFIIVLTTAPKKYTIDEPEGLIKSKSCIELYVLLINFCLKFYY